MNKKLKAWVVMLVAVFCILTCNVMPAFAYVDPTWEETTEAQEPETPAGETEAELVVPEETSAETEPESEQAFSTPGNGDLGDAITSGMKDFYTIHTKNNNTFYLVIDHSGNQDNVYMLSLIDENDLAEFMGEAAQTPEKEQQVVVVPEDAQEAETEAADVPEKEEPEPEKGTNFMMLAVLAAIGIAGALYYFKVYKRKKNADTWEAEGLEAGDGLDTENEDEEMN